MKTGLTIKSAVLASLWFVTLESGTAHAASISSFAFHSATSDCISEITTHCTDIFANGLSGAFQVDLDMLDATGNGGIAWNDFLGFEGTNSVSSWNAGNLSAGGVQFENWMIVEFGIAAAPDFGTGWDWPTDGGGEILLMDGFGVSAFNPAFTNASSSPGLYCPATGEWNPAGDCPGGSVEVYTVGIEASYAAPVIQQVPVPAALWLFGSGILGLALAGRRNTA
jgi:hypothetical protein